MSPYRAPERRSRKVGSPARAWRDGPAGRRAYDVPWSARDRRAPSDRWTPEAVVGVEVHGRTIDVVVDQLLGDHVHVCAPEDVGDVLELLPPDDVLGLDLVVLRQPTRKEQTLRPAWGRIAWDVAFRGYRGPALMLDAVALGQTLRWPRSMIPADVEELGRLRAAGFSVRSSRHGHDVRLDAVPVHRWLLSRTVPHEVGHWVDYRRRVLDPLPDDASKAEYDARLDRWMQRPHLEREALADRYADAMSAPILDALDHPRTDLHRRRPGGTPA